MTDKSPDAFRTISEVSEELDLPQHVLRFWETKFPLVKPLKRGGGRRYYRRGDIDLLRGIRHLLYTEGFTIKGVQKILREQGAKHVAEAWQEGAAPAPGEGGAEPAAARTASQTAPQAAKPAGTTATAKDLKGILKDLQGALVELERARKG